MSVMEDMMIDVSAERCVLKIGREASKIMVVDVNYIAISPQHCPSRLTSVQPIHVDYHTSFSPRVTGIKSDNYVNLWCASSAIRQ